MDLEEYLYHHIPLSQAMGIKVVEASAASATLSVPLTPNINHKQTAFGGSLHAAAALACWIYLYNRLEGAPQAQIVIAKSTTEYKAPVTANFLMTCPAPDETTWQRFLKIYQAKGKGRITLCAETPGFCFQGEFALIKR